MKIPVFAFFLGISAAALADFDAPQANRFTTTYVEIDGDASTNPGDYYSSDSLGLFDPAALFLSETGDAQHGSASMTIDHRSDITFSPSSIAFSWGDAGSAVSNPGDVSRGTIAAYSQTLFTFVSYTPFSFDLTANLSHVGSVPNALNPVSVILSDVNGVVAGFDLAMPIGTISSTLPAGSYALRSTTGHGFDAVFGNPPAASYSAVHAATWSFQAQAVPEPTSCALVGLGAAAMVRRRKG